MTHYRNIPDGDHWRAGDEWRLIGSQSFGEWQRLSMNLPATPSGWANSFEYDERHLKPEYRRPITSGEAALTEIDP